MSLNACVYTCISTGGETRTPVQKMGRVVSYLLWAVISQLLRTSCSQSSTAAQPEEEMCPCDCDYMDRIDHFKNASNSYVNKTQEELVQILQKKLDEVKEQLKVQMTDIPVVKARKVSATDARPSAKNVGLIGVGFLVFVFGGILVLDLLSLPGFLRRVKANLC
nr:uncharacterized protein LOC105330588 [Crassostrea gigas]|eukprot:XP_011430653.1 PREDICTED: uncharacterized protein LOC105330588 [Crassostrea gigas]